MDEEGDLSELFKDPGGKDDSWNGIEEALAAALTVYRVLKEYVRQFDQVAQSKPEAVRELMQGMDWVEHYEKPIEEVMRAVGGGPIENAQMSLLRTSSEPMSEMQRLVSGEVEMPNEDEMLAHVVEVFPVLYAMKFNILSMEYYSKYMSELAQDVLDGDDEAVIKMVSIDGEAIRCAPAAKRLRDAEIRGERKYKNRVYEAAKRGVDKRKTTKHDELCFLLYMLDRSGLIGKVNKRTGDEWFIGRLGVYPEGENADRSLERLVDRWMRERST